MEGEENRAKLVAAALNITRDTAIAPSQYELQLLDKYVRGVLTIDEVIVLLEENKPPEDEPESLASGSR